MKHIQDLVILEGLDVTVEYTIASAEPDVGIMSDYIEDWWITHVAGRECPEALRKALENFLTPRERDILVESLDCNPEPEYD